MICVFPLSFGKKKKSGRSSTGSILISNRGGGNKTLFKLIDYKRFFNFGLFHKVVKIFYDSVTNKIISLIISKTGFFSYIIAPVSLFLNFFVITSNSALINIGNRIPLSFVPLGNLIHHLELKKLKGAQLLRAPGCFGVIVKKFSKWYHLVKLKSGELRLIFAKNYNTLGIVSNTGHHIKKFVKAGESRYKNRKPRVRGVAMNPVDHPHGGGEGKTSGGRPSVSKWGWLTKGKKLSKKSNKFIIKKR